MATILVVDDDPEIVNVLCRAFGGAGHQTVSALSGPHALEASAARPPDLVILDQRMPVLSGIETFKVLRHRFAGVRGIIITAFGSPADQSTAFRAGVAAYFEKPFNLKDLVRAAEGLLSGRNESLPSAFEGMVGASTAIQKVFDRIDRFAALEANLLILGETGTGKELVARAVHNRSSRRSAPFIGVNCPAIPSSLFESEVFGHERGAFTSAWQSHPGLVERANTGTLFLDEVGDLSLELQSKLLRVLEQREVWRLGGIQPHRVEVRVIAATNLDPWRLRNPSLFRQDLYYRLAALEIIMPPLRARDGDLEILIQYFAKRAKQVPGVIARDFAEETLDVLLHHFWPGNVRELEHCIYHAFMSAEGPSVEISDLPDRLSSKTALARDTVNKPPADEFAQDRESILNQLSANSWNRKATARALGINVRTLFTRMRKLGIAVDTK